MTEGPWTKDACSLVDAFRAGDRSPVEELEATLAAIDSSELNCFSYLDPEGALEAAKNADITKPFGGVPTGIKELEGVKGWPDTGGSLVFKDRKATYTTETIRRFVDDGGIVPVGLTTSSEFGGLNVSVTKLNGVAHNPWRYGKTVGGSSGGSAAAVAGGLVSIASGGDGGGSIRIPAGYTGLVGMKGTYGRISRGPGAYFRPGTVVLGCLARSVRDVARHYDVTAGIDPYDPSSLPNPGNWEKNLGTHDLEGLRVAVLPDLGMVKLEPGVEDVIRSRAAKLIEAHGMEQVDFELKLPNLAAQWMMGNLSTLLAELGDRWPGCANDLTDEVAMGLMMSRSLYNLDVAAAAEGQRVEAYKAMAAMFEQVDLVIAATNPGPAFAADATTSSPTDSFLDWAKSNQIAKYAFRGVLGGARMVSAVMPSLPNKLMDQVNERFPDLVSMGGLTIISNIYGNPAVSIPGSTIDGLPVGVQVLAAHHRDGLLLDVAKACEDGEGWPLVAPAVESARAVNAN